MIRVPRNAALGHEKYLIRDYCCSMRKHTQEGYPQDPAFKGVTGFGGFLESFLLIT